MFNCLLLEFENFYILFVLLLFRKYCMPKFVLYFSMTSLGCLFNGSIKWTHDLNDFLYIMLSCRVFFSFAACSLFKFGQFHLFLWCLWWSWRLAYGFYLFFIFSSYLIINFFQFKFLFELKFLSFFCWCWHLFGN